MFSRGMPHLIRNRSVPVRGLGCARTPNPGGKMKKFEAIVSIALLALAGAAAAGEGTGQRPASISVDPSGRFAYVANLKSNDVSAYRIDRPSGALHAVPGSPFPAGTQPVAVAVDSRGRFVYVPNQLSGTLSAYRLDGSSGA